MPKTKNRRWVCPDCGAGKLAPGRPRRDDVRRFCLPCSERTGRLVERVCPSNERARELSSERSKRKAGRRRAVTRKVREAAAERARDEKTRLIPYQRFFRRALRLKSWEIDLATRPPRVFWKIAPDDGREYRASGNGSRRSVGLDLGTGVASNLELILHELAHAAYDGANRGFPRIEGEGRFHNARFRTLLCDATAEVTGAEIQPVASTAEMDRVCTRALLAWLYSPECRIPELLSIIGR